jgi:formylglycine-generating enzyme required for sulfatase activity
MELESGSNLSRYKVGDRLGAGGMGVVYRAFDTRLERQVALKLLPPEAVGDFSRRERFVREAKAASALNHPHIVTVFDIDRVTTASGEVDLIAMELVDGEPLDRRLARGPLPVREALELAIQLAGALAAAHRAGIVHRDVKPGNTMLTASGQLKLLDFGLASSLPGVDLDTNAATVAAGLTTTGAVVGTPAYMSPEQAIGQPADARSDVFAAGSVLYEMLAGRRPFSGATPMEQIVAVAHGEATPIARASTGVPAALARVVDRSLAKNAAERYPSAVELHAELVTLRDELFAPRATFIASLRRPAVAVPLAAALVAALAGAGWWALHVRERAHARAELVRLEELVAERDLVGAWLLARELEPVLGDDRELERLQLASTWIRTFQSDPAGAEIAFRDYLGDPTVWYPIGTTPIDGIRLPAQGLLFRATAPGHVTVEGAPFAGDSSAAIQFKFTLWRAESTSAGMVRIPDGPVGLSQYTFDDHAPVSLPAFWFGRHEVTHREFQAFVDSDGYRNPAFWREPFARDGRTIDWKEAVAGFVDATGRPGPATWRLGTFPDGQGDHPVTGVSWYEAAAYARWADAELPTLHHWFRAAAPSFTSEIMQRARFGGDGTVPVGSSYAIGPLGAHDMAGNAFEWTASADSEGRRYAAGGAWDEPNYSFLMPAALDPHDRGPNRGLRLARYDGAVPEATRRPLVTGRPDFARRAPVGDEMFAAFESFYAYDQRPLEPAVESVDDASTHYRWERVSYDAAYGGERVLANLLLPKNASPPYQVVIYFPGSEAERFESSLKLDGLPMFEFILRSGRAVLYPVYKNTFERRIPGWSFSPASRRDVLIQWRKDLGRSIDYIASRDDLDSDRIAFYGLSLGAVYGTVLTALEPRLDAALMLGGGVNPGSLPPEADPLNFAPRVRVPTLMLTGRDDFIRPVETHQVPLFRLLGVPEEQKRLARFDGGHLPSDMNAVIREALAWLDRWLGVVETHRRAAGGG